MIDSSVISDLERREKGEAIAAAWRSVIAGTSFVPLSIPDLKEHFSRLATDVLDALEEEREPAAVLRRGRAIGRELVRLNLHKPDALEHTLSTLAEHLAGFADPEQLARLSVGIAGGFAGAMEASLLRQQESISQAATTVLSKAQEELKVSRDGLAVANEELSAQIIERTRTEEKQHDFAERLQQLHRIDTAILSAESLPAIAEIVLAYVDHLIPAISVSVLLLDMDKQRLTVIGSTHPAYPPGREMPITLLDLLNRLGKGEYVYISDYAALQPSSPAVIEVIEYGGRSGLALPLRYRNELIGAFTIVLGEARLFSETEMALARELADSMAVALQNRRLLEAERVARERETTLREVAAALTLGLSLDELLALILERLGSVIANYSSAILLLESDLPVMVAQRGIPRTIDHLNRLVADRPLSIWAVLETGRPQVINDTHGSPVWEIIEGLEYIRAWMGIPLLVKGNCIGILTVDRATPNAFTERDRELAMTFANQVSIAIDNARLFARQQAHAEELEQSVRERTRDLEVLYGITATAVGHPDMERLLQRSMALTAEAFGCAAAAVHLIEGDESGLYLAASLAEGEPTMGALLSGLALDDTALRLPLSTGNPQILTGDALPPGWDGRQALTLTTVPLRSRGQYLGVLSLLCDGDAKLTNVAPDLLTTIADQMGAAVENIRLHHITRQTAIIEERERLARDIHDQVTQSIYSASLFAEAARGAAEVGNMTKVKQHHQSILRMTNQALRELRLLLSEFRTEALARKGLIDALRERLNTVEHRAGISGEVHAPGIGVLPMPIEETFHRIALEALNNSLRHAQGDRVDIILLEEEGDLIMTIVDNGIGFDREAAANSGGMGLEGMQKRIGKVSGFLTLSSSPEGTWVTARAPLKQ